MTRDVFSGFQNAWALAETERVMGAVKAFLNDPLSTQRTDALGHAAVTPRSRLVDKSATGWGHDAKRIDCTGPRTAAR
jgi:hypothetical protein